MNDFSLPFETADGVAIVREAANLALELRGRYAPDIKPDNTLVTQADREIEEFLRTRLATIAPDWGFLGEESGLEGDPDAPCWVIDPIDGTTNFVRGLPLWCVSVGVVFRGRAVWGGLAVPMQNEMFWAAQGAGAWRTNLAGGDAMQLRVEDATELMQEDLIGANTTIGVDFRAVPCRLRNLGSIAYHLSAAARGAFAATLMRQHKIYDIAAGACLCLEAGLEARYLDGREWRAEVVAPKETQPLIFAPPHTMETLLANLKLL